MAKKTEAEKTEALKLVALERIAASLGRIEAIMATPKKTRWYEASWITPFDSDQFARYRATPRRHHVAVEAFDADEARNSLRADLKAAPTTGMLPAINDDPAMLLRHLTGFQLRPLGEHQCRYCCSTKWAEDGEKCLACHRTPEEALRERRAGRFDQNPRDSNGEC